jgi:hypothetical protein
MSANIKLNPTSQKLTTESGTCLGDAHCAEFHGYLQQHVAPKSRFKTNRDLIFEGEGLIGVPGHDHELVVDGRRSLFVFAA